MRPLAREGFINFFVFAAHDWRIATTTLVLVRSALIATYVLLVVVVMIDEVC